MKPETLLKELSRFNFSEYFKTATFKEDGVNLCPKKVGYKFPTKKAFIVNLIKVINKKFGVV